MPEPTVEVHCPPFPPLLWNDGDWLTTCTLEAWEGFLSWDGLAASPTSAGAASLYVESPNPQQKAQPSAAQATAFRFLLLHQTSIRDAMLSALAVEYEKWRAEWSSAMVAEEFARLMPPVAMMSGFRELIGLLNIYMLAVAEDEIAYIGFGFGCAWDDEHGLGVLTHGQRVVEVGGEDTAFIGWNARRDAATQTGTAS